MDLLCPRIQHLCTRYRVPFLIESTTYYFPALADTDSQGNTCSEIDFLNQILTRTEYGLLLDLYNFYCNAMNFGFDPYSALAGLKLEQFKCFLQQHPHVNSLTKNMAAFEAGIKLASQLATISSTTSNEHFSLALIFDRDPAALLGALLTGRQLPSPAPENYCVEINSRCATLWRSYPCDTITEHLQHHLPTI